MSVYFCRQTGVRLVAPGVSKAVDPANGVDEFVPMTTDAPAHANTKRGTEPTKPAADAPPAPPAPPAAQPPAPPAPEATTTPANPAEPTKPAADAPKAKK